MTVWDQFLSNLVFLFLAPVGLLLINIFYVQLVPSKTKVVKPLSVKVAGRVDKQPTSRTTESIRFR